MILMKPHHLIDIITDLGRGHKVYTPHPYGHALHTVAAQVHADPDVMLQIELGIDDICKPCTHNIDGLCDDTIDTSYRPQASSSKREWNLLIDERWCERLGIKQGEKMTAREFCRIVQEKAGDITDIYREIPAEMTGERAEKLGTGILKYLGR